MLEFTCDICGVIGQVGDMIERELVGEKRSLCVDCHEYLSDKL